MGKYNEMLNTLDLEGNRGSSVVATSTMDTRSSATSSRVTRLGTGVSRLTSIASRKSGGNPNFDSADQVGHTSTMQSIDFRVMLQSWGVDELGPLAADDRDFAWDENVKMELESRIQEDIEETSRPELEIVGNSSGVPAVTQSRAAVHILGSSASTWNSHRHAEPQRSG